MTYTLKKQTSRPWPYRPQGARDHPVVPPSLGEALFTRREASPGDGARVGQPHLLQVQAMANTLSQDNGGVSVAG